jgi:hypothetical protein
VNTSRALRPHALLILLNLLSTLATYAVGLVPWGGEPAAGLSLIQRFWDGPVYVAVARSLYDPACGVFAAFGATYGIRVILPVTPLSIRLLSPIFGYFDAMLVVTFVFSCLCFSVLYRLLDEFRLVGDPLWCTAAFVFFPPRWVIYHSVGASEPPFLLFILCAFYFYRKRSLALAGLFGGLASITRIYGVLLFPAFLLAELTRLGEISGWSPRQLVTRRSLTSLLRVTASFLPIPIFLGLHFLVLSARLGNFWAYFSENADKMSWVPFRGIFDAGLHHEASEGYGTVLLYLALAYGLVWLWRNGHKDAFFVSALLALPNVFTTLPDQGRFMVPVYPFLLVIPFGELWSRREAKWALLLCLPATYAYVWSSILVNLVSLDVYEKLRTFVDGAGG